VHANKVTPGRTRRRVSYLGHATTLIELDGARLLTDPLLRRRVAHLVRTSSPPDPPEIDAVLISHGHLDHLDLPSLERLARATPIVVPAGLGRLVRSRGFQSVSEVEAGDEVAVADVTVRATPADHPGRPAPGRSAKAVGYAVLGSRRVYFAGDTDLFDGMAGLVEQLDIALLPIWGWGPSLGTGHLDPGRAAEALALLAPRLAVPIHWGTLRPFYRTPRAHYLREPVDTFVAAARELAPGIGVRVLAPGESLDF
jgi:L-ascorbate metabolism protein UlaG (beta-lactamase superfamily)